MSAFASRIAGAPISWGVSEVPGWGYQLKPERVLAEMRAIGLTATEFGPAGFLPHDPVAKARLLEAYGLEPVGGFVPLVLHDSQLDPLPEVDSVLDSFVAAHGGVLVVAAATGLRGYDERPSLDETAWQTLLTNLDRVSARAADRGVQAALHPHVGTAVERHDEVRRVLDGSSISLCMDTGHLLIGGSDPLEIAARASDRIGHIHLKNVDVGQANRVMSRDVSYTDAVRQGLYRPLGQGDIDMAGIVRTLEAAAYRGWYVVEQDIMLPSEPTDEGPLADVRASVEYLRGLA